MSTTTRRSRGRPAVPPEQQRRRLFEAAERCFGRARYESVTVQDIVREAGMSSRSFYELFENKEELVIGLAMQRGDEFLARLESAVAESDNVLEAVERMVTSFLEDLPWVMLDLERISGTMSSRVREIRDVYREKIADVLMRQIQFVVKAGLIAPEDAPSPMSLLLLLSGIEAFAIRYYGEGRQQALSALHPQLMAALRELLPRIVNPDLKTLS